MFKEEKDNNEVKRSDIEKNKKKMGGTCCFKA